MMKKYTFLIPNGQTDCFEIEAESAEDARDKLYELLQDPDIAADERVTQNANDMSHYDPDDAYLDYLVPNE